MTDDSTVPFAALGRSVSHSGRGAPSTEAAYRELWAARRMLQAVRASRSITSCCSKPPRTR